ncbi:GRB10-interacting GYF protein 2-like isoform X2 [Physella acuta]|uniref:GRB10-interacting GYF protein 2-like isoform X2 n=1 Tax=Physella acuta TaxID=109671 RepID=UPI0027DC6E68|nr:GRB10-interacting GYF protein 2-like isoform X2 [Physella acuta]
MGGHEVCSTSLFRVFNPQVSVACIDCAVQLKYSKRNKMALKFGPQWLRDLSDGGTTGSQPPTPTSAVKFKLADYRYGREEMLALFNENSPPPDQVRKHLSIFSKEIQKPITMLPLTEDEQRLISQGFNSTVVLRAAGRGTGPPLRPNRGGGISDRGRGRGRGRGEGYVPRSENGDYSRSTQDGWEQVNRKFERSYSRGYDEAGVTKREFTRSTSDNWRDKRNEEEDEEETGGVGWRNNRDNTRWGPSTRSTNWRDPQRDNSGFDGDRRQPLPHRTFEQDHRGPHRINDNYENEGEVPEWVEDDVGDDPGTFDSSGAFVSTKEGKQVADLRRSDSNTEENRMKSTSRSQEETTDSNDPPQTNITDKGSTLVKNKSVYVPPAARNGTGDANNPVEISRPQSLTSKDNTESFEAPPVSIGSSHSNKGDGDSGFAFPNKEDINGTRAPPGQYTNTSVPTSQPQTSSQSSEQETQFRHADQEILHMEKSLQSLVAEMTADADRRARSIDVTQSALPLSHEDANKWFYKDPQGEVQGPFSNEEMSQWFSAGYFTMSLVVKRGCDDTYKQLGELIKRYGRVPFLPGPPLPPLITSNIQPEVSLSSTPPLTMPSLISPMAAPIIGPPLSGVHDPAIIQQMLIQQEYLKQSYLRQWQLQENFKALPPEQQQQQISLQLMMQANPLFLQQLQQQQLILQQQEHQRSSTQSVEGNPSVFQQSQPNTITTANSGGDVPMWGGAMQPLIPGMWSLPATQPVTQPTSLWDVDNNSGTVSPAYRAQIEKLKREREEERLKEEERIREEELEKRQEELRRQQEEIERQRELMKMEKIELEKQKQLEIQKIEEARRLEEERIRLEIERQQQEQLEEEKRRQEIAKKQQEEERKREKELKKQEEKRRKEDEKRSQEEIKRQQEELRRKLEEEELLRQQEIQLEREFRRQQELQQMELQKQEEEERREAVERERQEAHKKQHLEMARQQESLRRLQQAQREQLANIQLPPSTNWAAQQHSVQASPSQSKSLTEIQEEEARKEQERQREQLQQMQRMQEQANLIHQQHAQKSWATHACQGLPNKGLSLLDIQQQEAENAKKSQKEKPNTQTYTAKLSLASASTWTGTTSGGTWGNSNQVWNSTSSNAGFWDSVAIPSVKKPIVKESGEFPALKPQAQQAKKGTVASTTKVFKAKAPGSKQKKEEESVQKLFQNRQQDDFTLWVTERVSQFSARIDEPTFVSFIVDVDSPDEVRDYINTYLGETKDSKEFAKQFLERRNRIRNQVRIEKQQEEDSIWGPAPAINPHNQMRGSVNATTSAANEGNEANSGKGKNRKKKQKMQKLDVSILGFTVQADPNRKNVAGEVESIQ